MKLFGVNFILFLVSLFSCSSQEYSAPGSLTDSINCRLVPEQYYCLYIPIQKEGNEKLPVLFLFDPAARAKETVEQYKSLADKYGIILACSYNSKNGPLEQNKKAADAMISDALERFPVDENNIFLSGFSGGSRFSYIYASQNPKIKGVIACGAFSPGNTKTIPPPTFTYSGISGTFDFNFLEGLSMHNFLSQQGIPFQFITFEGKHEWPQDSVFERALTYQLSRIDEFKNLILKSSLLELKFLSHSKANGDYVNAAWIFKNLMITDVNKQSEYSDSLQTLLKSKAYNQQENAFLRSLRMEDTLKAEIYDAMQGILMTTYNKYDTHLPLTWWKNELKKLSRLEENSKEIYKRNVGKRVKGQIGVMLWESNRRFMQEKFYEQALELAEILLLLDTESETYLALKAEVIAAKGKNNEAINLLKQAKAKGFTMDNPFLRTSEILIKLNQEISNEEKEKQIN